jgi:LmbE family N-acetylglucosaminyl deacetylase
VPWQSWGVPKVSRARGWRTFFKGGWRLTASGQLVHQIARLERPGVAITIAVLTNGNPSHGYGRWTVRGIAARLLAGPREAAARRGRRGAGSGTGRLAVLGLRPVQAAVAARALGGTLGQPDALERLGEQRVEALQPPAL